MTLKQESSLILVEVVEKLSLAQSLEEVTQTIAEAARNLIGACGATFVLKEDGSCFYADENAISPLWKGKKFPLESCISGWAMLHREVVVVPDIYQDARIPIDAYRPTFVKSLCMTPIRYQNPLGAIGCYWSYQHVATEEEIKLVQILASSTSVALENLLLKTSNARWVDENDSLNSQKKEMELQIHALAHDLKSPLATMIGMAEFVQIYSGASLDDKGKKYLDSILKVGERLNRQIESVLKMHLLNNREVKKSRIDLSQMVSDLVESIKSQYPGKSFEVSITPKLMAKADAELIQIVLENLLSNAFKYSSKKENPKIEFGKLENGNQSFFYVKDNGAGFDSKSIDKLFKPFSRLHSVSQFEGTGLGLNSAHRVITLHGGHITAQGAAGQGAEFLFSLPA